MIDNGPTVGGGGAESLREQVMMAQFQGATGCTREQARQLLQAATWEFQTALSMFFQECAIPPPQQAVSMVPNNAAPAGQSIFVQPQCRVSSTGGSGHFGQACAPCNTPATPPNFPEALLALQKWQAGGTDWSSPAAAAANSPPAWQQQQQQAPPKILASFNPMPPPGDRYVQSCDWPTAIDAFSSTGGKSQPPLLDGDHYQQFSSSTHPFHHQSESLSSSGAVLPADPIGGITGIAAAATDSTAMNPFYCTRYRSPSDKIASENNNPISSSATTNRSQQPSYNPNTTTNTATMFVGATGFQ